MATQKQENQIPSTVKSGPKPYGSVVLTLKNCLLPEEKLATTPSHLDGLDYGTETDLRILGCELIQTAGILLKLPQVGQHNYNFCYSSWVHLCVECLNQ